MGQSGKCKWCKNGPNLAKAGRLSFRVLSNMNRVFLVRKGC